MTQVDAAEFINRAIADRVAEMVAKGWDQDDAFDHVYWTVIDRLRAERPDILLKYLRGMVVEHDELAQYRPLA